MEMTMKCEICNGKIKCNNPKLAITYVNMVIFAPRGGKSRPIMPLCDDCYNRLVARVEEMGMPIAHGTVGFDLSQGEDRYAVEPLMGKDG